MKSLPPSERPHMLTSGGNDLERSSMGTKLALPQHEGMATEIVPQLPGLAEVWTTPPVHRVLLPSLSSSSAVFLFRSLGLKNVLEISGRSVCKWCFNITTSMSKNNIHVKLDNIGMSEKRLKHENQEQIMIWEPQITELIPRPWVSCWLGGFIKESTFTWFWNPDSYLLSLNFDIYFLWTE